ncbi:hypothetical protein BDW62DRAFT_216060 [Aspergillus aurantiobrunneus]
MRANKLPLVNLGLSPTPALVSEIESAFRWYGAIRLAVPQDPRYHPGDVFQNPEDIRYPRPEFYHSVKVLYKEWTPSRLHLLKTISQILDSDTPLMGTALLECATLRVHYYDSQNLHAGTHFSPAHKDSGTLTILLRSHNENDGLEIADLRTSEEHDSDGIGSEASFVPVPTARDVREVIIFAGSRLQRLLGRDRVRARVHRVRIPGPGSYTCGVQRLSIAMFCAPSMPSTQRSPPLACS